MRSSACRQARYTHRSVGPRSPTDTRARPASGDAAHDLGLEPDQADQELRAHHPSVIRRRVLEARGRGRRRWQPAPGRRSSILHAQLVEHRLQRRLERVIAGRVAAAGSSSSGEQVVIERHRLEAEITGDRRRELRQRARARSMVIGSGRSSMTSGDGKIAGALRSRARSARTRESPSGRIDSDRVSPSRRRARRTAAAGSSERQPPLPGDGEALVLGVVTATVGSDLPGRWLRPDRPSKCLGMSIPVSRKMSPAWARVRRRSSARSAAGGRSRPRGLELGDHAVAATRAPFRSVPTMHAALDQHDPDLLAPPEN